MTLMLDQRRKAMLKAAGIEVWWQTVQASAAPEPVEVPTAEVRAPVLARQAQPQEPLVPQAQSASSVAAAPALAPVPSPAPISAPTPAPRAAPSRVAAAPAVAAAPSWQAPVALPWAFSPAQRVFAAAQAEADTAAVQWLFVTDHFADLAEEAQAAQQLFLNMLGAMGLAQSPQVWQASMRKMGQEEAPVSYPTLDRQALLASTTPQVIVAMGRVAAQVLLESSEPLGALRQTVIAQQNASVVVTYSPSYLLRSPKAKAGAWADLRLAMQVALSQGQAAKSRG